MSLLTRRTLWAFFGLPIIVFNIYFCFADYIWWLSSAFNIALWSFYDSISFLWLFISFLPLFNKADEKSAQSKNNSRNCLLNNLILHDLHRRRRKQKMINLNSEKNFPQGVTFFIVFSVKKQKIEARNKSKKNEIIMIAPRNSFAALLHNVFMIRGWGTILKTFLTPFLYWFQCTSNVANAIE